MMLIDLVFGPFNLQATLFVEKASLLSKHSISLSLSLSQKTKFN